MYILRYIRVMQYNSPIKMAKINEIQLVQNEVCYIYKTYTVMMIQYEKKNVTYLNFTASM